MPDDQTTAEVLAKVTLEFGTSDGPEVRWRVHQMRLVEAINEDYELELDLVTRDVEADMSTLLGASAELELARGEHARVLYGIVSEVEHAGQWGDDLVVRVRVVPAFALMRQNVRSRIFQNLSVRDILERVLGDGLGEYGRTFALGTLERGTEVRDYCVQYHESDREFVARLLEEEGISFHFSHDESLGHEVLVLTEDNRQLDEVRNVDGTALIPIVARRPELVAVESMRNLDWVRTLSPTSTTRRDYDWRHPLEPLTSHEGKADDRGRTRRSYDHLRRRFTGDDLAARAKDRLESLRMRQAIGRGESNATAFTAGKVFALDRHAHAPELEGSHVLLCVVHEAHCPEELISSGESENGSAPDSTAPIDRPRYHNVFESVPIDVPVRPPRVTPKPEIRGPQTAIVVGPPGEEIETDEHGRIKVQFAWEEDGRYDQTSSCWVRVAQTWAGAGWGAQFIPRVGMEVVVVFLEGDPDRPLVTGCVYNAANTPPFALPDDKTQSGIRTDSSIGPGFNELRFEDGAGIEEIYIRAQRDKRVEIKHDHFRLVEHDESIHVLNDRAKAVARDQSEAIGRDKNITVGGKHTEQVTGDYSEAIGGSHDAQIDGSRTVSVAENDARSVGQDASVSVEKNSTERVGGDKRVEVDGTHDEKVGGARRIRVTKELETESGDDTSIRADKHIVIAAAAKASISSQKAMSLQTSDAFSIDGKKKGVLEFAEELTIKVGKASIVLKKSGDIEISGGLLKIKTSGDVTVKGGKIKQN